jgi:hypothetical protein
MGRGGDVVGDGRDIRPALESGRDGSYAFEETLEQW